MSRRIPMSEPGHRAHLKCNGQSRFLLSYYELTEKQRADVDYMGPLDEKNDEHYSPRFFIYRGSVYDSSEFEVAPDWLKAQGFDGIQTESYFSAVVLRYFDADGHMIDGGDSVAVGYVHW